MYSSKTVFAPQPNVFLTEVCGCSHCREITFSLFSQHKPHEEMLHKEPFNCLTRGLILAWSLAVYKQKCWCYNSAAYRVPLALSQKCIQGSDRSMSPLNDISENEFFFKQLSINCLWEIKLLVICVKEKWKQNKKRIMSWQKVAIKHQH